MIVKFYCVNISMYTSSGESCNNFYTCISLEDVTTLISRFDTEYSDAVWTVIIYPDYKEIEEDDNA